MKLLFAGLVVGFICGALVSRRHAGIVEKAVALAKAVYAKIKNKIKAQ